MVEFGSGSSTKTRILLLGRQALAGLCAGRHLRRIPARAGGALRREYPALAMLPVAADFTQPFDLPAAVADGRASGFFPGSTIGNFEPHEAAAFLRHAAPHPRAAARASLSAPTW